MRNISLVAPEISRGTLAVSGCGNATMLALNLETVRHIDWPPYARFVAVLVYEHVGGTVDVEVTSYRLFLLILTD